MTCRLSQAKWPAHLRDLPISAVLVLELQAFGTVLGIKHRFSGWENLWTISNSWPLWKRLSFPQCEFLASLKISMNHKSVLLFLASVLSVRFYTGAPLCGFYSFVGYAHFSRGQVPRGRVGEPLDACILYCRRAAEVCWEEAFDYLPRPVLCVYLSWCKSLLTSGRFCVLRSNHLLGWDMSLGFEFAFLWITSVLGYYSWAY